jgi:hypothetical protein
MGHNSPALDVLTVQPLPSTALAGSHGGTALLDRVEDVRGLAGQLVDPIGLVTLPSEPVLLDRNGQPDWVIVDLEDDPQFKAGAMGIPRDVQQHLAAVAATGVSFDKLYVAHELAPWTVRHRRPGVPAAALIPAAPEDPVAQRLHDGLSRAGRRVGAIVATLAAVAGAVVAVVVGVSAIVAILAAIAAAGVGLLVAAAVVGVAAASLDPVLLGAVIASGKASPGETALLVRIAHWE